MITSAKEMISMLLPNPVAETDMVIERFDEWHNPQDVNAGSATPCICG